MVKEVIFSIVANYGIAALGFAAGIGVKVVKAKLGEKKYQRIVKDCRIAVSALWDANKELGLEKIEKIAINQVLGYGKHKNIELVEAGVKKVIASLDSMADDMAATEPQKTAEQTQQAIQQ